jgi:hypothetical protein
MLMSDLLHERLNCLKEYILLRKISGQVEIEWKLIEERDEDDLCIHMRDINNICVILITYPLDISEIVLDFIKTELYTIVG